MLMVALAQPFLTSQATTLSVRCSSEGFVAKVCAGKVPLQATVTVQVWVAVVEFCGA